MPDRTQLYERANALWTQENGGTIEIRASAVNNCSRALWYSLMGTPKSDPNSITTDTILKMGQALEPLALRQSAFINEWLYHPQQLPDILKLNVPLAPNYRITGIADAIMGDQEGNIFPVEIKTRNERNFDQVVRRGNYQAKQEAVMQLAFYTKALHNVITGPDAYIVTLNRSTGALHQEAFSRITLEKVWLDIQQRVLQIAEHWQPAMDDPKEETLPPPEMPQNHWLCHYCEWKTTCGNVTNADPQGLSSSRNFTNEELDAMEDNAQTAIAEYVESILKKEQQIDQSKKNALRKTIMDYVALLPAGKCVFTHDGEDYSCSINTGTQTTYNMDTVRYLLGPEKMEAITVEKDKTPYLTIRQLKST